MPARLFAWPDRLAAAYARRPAAWRGAFAVALLVVLAFTVARYADKAATPSRDGTLTRTALLRWRPQIQALERGENIYATHNYPNPPVMAMILWPFTEFPRLAGPLWPFTEVPPVAGGVLWLLMKAGMAVLAAAWAFRLVGPLSAPAKGLVVTLAAHPVIGDLNHGNVNIFIAFLVMGCLELYRRRWDGWAGVVLALAIACKVTPALFLPYFGWKAAQAAARSGRVAALWGGGGKVLAGAAVGLGLFLFVVPAAVLAARLPGGPAANLRAGWDENRTLLASWFDGMVRPFLVDGKVTSIHANQSIPGVVNRLLTREPSAEEYDEESGKMLPHEFHNLTDIGAGGAKRVVQATQAAFVLAVLLLFRSDSRSARGGMTVAAECGLIVLGMLLFSERTWKHHGTALVLPVAVVVAAWPGGAGAKLVALVVLPTVAALTLIPSLLGGRAQDIALTYGTHTATYLLLAAAVVGVLWRGRLPLAPASPPASPPAP